MKADEASIYEASGARDCEQGASAGDIDNHNVRACRVDSMSAFREGDDRFRERDVFDRGVRASAWFGERHYGAVM
jgi:hypothetical protein